MGTHPIFESDFDCLTENEQILHENVQVNKTSGNYCAKEVHFAQTHARKNTKLG